MKLAISQPAVWGAYIEDRPAALAEKLEALSDAGANLEFMLARRAPETPGSGVVFLAPLKGAKLHRIARDNGFFRTEAIHSVRVEGADKAGSGTRITRAIADAGINLRGFSASVIGRKFIGYLAFDDVDDARKTIRLLRNLA